MNPLRAMTGFVLTLATTLAAAGDRDDVVVADFESPNYGTWVATGEAFGRGPARGTLPGQMEVTGFQGKGLVNSFVGGDAMTGTLTSPPFPIERKYLNFLIGGGGHAGETCMNLLVDGKVVRTATGPNDKPGGSERLGRASWDVTEFAGKRGVLQVVDRRTDGWGHINVDQVVLSDTKRGTEPAVRDLVVGKRYLHLPVANSAPVRRVRVAADGKTVDEFDIKLAEGRPDFRVFRDLAGYQGARLRVEANLPSGSAGLAGLVQSDEVPGAQEMYREKDRPQFHFTARRGWLNDPNGLVWYEGEYHLFFQHNPYGWDWGNMHWGHAVSPDLVHWTELGEALTPRRYEDWCFSGSAVVDRDNTSGFGRRGSHPLVLAYTSTGRGECVAFSNDRGRTWTEFEGNPVVKHAGRDPRLLWHAATDRWVMAVYDETGGRKAIVFHSSTDLKQWREESRIDGFYECPDLFELAVEGHPGRTFWVLYGADGEYLLGRFDGKSFTPVGPGKQRLWHGDFYAAQTFSNTPRRPPHPGRLGPQRDLPRDALQPADDRPLRVEPPRDPAGGPGVHPAGPRNGLPARRNPGPSRPYPQTRGKPARPLGRPVRRPCGGGGGRRGDADATRPGCPGRLRRSETHAHLRRPFGAAGAGRRRGQASSSGRPRVDRGLRQRR